MDSTIEFASVSMAARYVRIPDLLKIDREINAPYLRTPRVFNSQAWSRRLELPWAVSQIGSLQDTSILDVGSGDSPMPIFLAREGAAVVSIDPQASQILRRGDVPRVKARLPNLPFGDGSFDVVTCISVLEHIKDDVDRSIAELCRIARRRVILTFDVGHGPLAKGGLSKTELRAVARLLHRTVKLPDDLLGPSGSERKAVGTQIAVCLLSADVQDCDLEALRLSALEKFVVGANRSFRHVNRAIFDLTPGLLPLVDNIARRMKRRTQPSRSAASGMSLASHGRANPTASPPARALNWIRAQELHAGGIASNSSSEATYPEVTGYLIPTLIRHGETQLATRATKWLVGQQAADGSFLSPEGIGYPFDTAQVLRGLIAGMGLFPQAREAARRAADYLVGEIQDHGGTGFGQRYSGEVPETVHLYALPPLYEVSSIFGLAEYSTFADQAFQYYSSHDSLLRATTLTHYQGYEIEALLDLGHGHKSAGILQELAERQSADGAVPGRPGAAWVCTPGIAQLAICWFKTEEVEAANRALGWLEAHQETTGGFLGSYGPGADYYPDVEIPWSAKFYLDANSHRIRSFFNREMSSVDTFVSPDDGRALEVLKRARPQTNVLELGCGKGRYLGLLKQLQPSCRLVGLDVTSDYLSYVHPEIGVARGQIEILPFRSGSFDFVFTVEALEHSANIQASLQEMVRVTRPGGTVLILDKDSAKWGAFDCPPWEQWMDRTQLTEALSRLLGEVTVRPIAFAGYGPSTGIMQAWSGKRLPEEPDVDGAR